jgi:hypothetical protein
MLEAFAFRANCPLARHRLEAGGFNGREAR